MIILGRVEFKNGWCHVGKNITKVENVLGDGIPRRPENEIRGTVTKLKKDENWQVDIGDKKRSNVPDTTATKKAG